MEPGRRAGYAAVWAAGDVSAQMAAAIALAEAVPPESFARFLEDLHRLPAHSARGLASRTLLRRWVAVDPEAALAWCAARDGDLVAGVAGEWARRDPDRSDAILGLLPAERLLEGTVAVFEALVSHDREAAMALLARPELAAAAPAIGPSLRALAGADPAWLLERAEALPDPSRRSVRAAVAQSMAEADPAQAME